MPFNRYLEDELDYVEKWGNSIREVVTESLSAARLLIPSASLSWNCLICKISVYVALEAAVLQCAGFCSYNRLLQYGWENYPCKVSQLTLKHHKN